MLGEIRLQWWREAIEEIVEGQTRAHPVVQALAPCLGAGVLAARTCQALIDGRAADHVVNRRGRAGPAPDQADLAIENPTH